MGPVDRNQTPSDSLPPQPFRLAFAIQRYFPYGGLQRDLLRTALACAEFGHDVHILTSKWEGPPPPRQVHVHLLRIRAWTNHGRNRAFGKAVRRFTRRTGFDCLIGFNKIAGLHVYWAGDLCLAQRLGRRKRRVLSLLPRYRTLLKLEAAVLGPRSDAEVLVLAEREKARIVRHYNTREERLHLMPPGIDCERFAANSEPGPSVTKLRGELGIGREELMILTVGSSFKTKGIDRAICAVASLPEPQRNRTKFVVAGSDNPRPFQRLARQLNLSNQVVFTGGRDDVAGFYRSADLLLHPARTETTGNTLLEAMVCGLPVLVTQNCGYSVHVRRANAGLVCPTPFEQPELNRLLAEMLSPGARAVWRRNALDYCRQVNLDGLLNRTVEIILARAERNRRAA